MLQQDHRAACLAVLEEIGLLGRLRREMAKAVNPDLHGGSAAVLWRIAEQGSPRMSDLANQLHVDQSVISRQTTELENAGLVERRPDPNDGRACLLSLTPTGKEVLQAMTARLVDRFEVQLENWTVPELLHVADAMHRLREDLRVTTPTC